MRSRYGLRWFALGLLIAGGQLGVLWQMDAWVPDPPVFVYYFGSLLDEPDTLPWSEGWLLISSVSLMAFVLTYLGALDDDSGSSLAEEPAAVWRRQHVFAFHYSSSAVLWAWIFALWLVGDASLLSACDSLAESLPFPCFAPRAQLVATLLCAAWLACLSAWSGVPPGYLRPEDEFASLSAGMGWGLLPALLITSPPFVA